MVVEFAETKSDQSCQIYPAMVELSYMCGDVVFILVLGDESDATRALLKREGIENVPHFNFYKTMEKIHEEEGIGPDQLMGDVLYYGDNHSAGGAASRQRRRGGADGEDQGGRKDAGAGRGAQALWAVR